MLRPIHTSRLAFLAASLFLAITSSASAQTRYATHIQSTPPGATVFLDSTTTPALGVTPLRSVRIARGQHNFIFRLEGYQETTVPFEVRRYGQTVTATLQQLARVQITATDASAQGASVTIDGAVVGTIPYNGSLRPDRVQIVISREGFVSSDQWVTLSAGQVFTWPVTLQRNAPRTGSLSIFSDARGVPVFIDGTQRCSTPCTLGEIAEGPHLVEVRPADGSRPFTQQVTIVAGQPSSVDAQLTVGGSIRVISRTAGATVTIDGELVGAVPATRDGLSAGDHIVEVAAPNYQTGQQTVTVVAGQQRVVSMDLTAAAATSGTLRVIGTPRGATVTVDGAAIGELPAETTLTPGEHIVEVSMAGFTGQTQTVTIVAGQSRVVSVALAENRSPGRFLVRSNVPGSTVLIDGSGPFPVPYAMDSAPVGTHAIIVRSAGYTEFSTTCTVGPGQDCAINAELTGATTRLRVSIQSHITGATLLVDSVEVGPVPFDGNVPVGPHRLEVRAPGYRTNTQQLQLSENEPPRVLDLTMVGENELTPEELAEREHRRERAMRNAFGRTGATLPPDLAVVELLAGWPYLAEVRFNMGVHENVDIGLGVRNAGRITEFMAQGRGGYRVNTRFSVGGAFQIGGGVGPTRTESGVDHKTSSFLLSADARASFHATRVAAFTLNAGVEFTSDRYDYELRDTDVLIPNAGRQNLLRGRLGAILELALSNHDSLIFQAMAMLGEPRRVLGDMFGGENTHYESSNLGVHTDLRIGWMHKFNWRYDEEY